MADGAGGDGNCAKLKYQSRWNHLRVGPTVSVVWFESSIESSCFQVFSYESLSKQLMHMVTFVEVHEGENRDL